jgi:hypothetical protein
MRLTKQTFIFLFALEFVVIGVVWYSKATNRKLIPGTSRTTTNYQTQPLTGQALQDSISKRENEILERIHEIMASASLCRR